MSKLLFAAIVLAALAITGHAAAAPSLTYTVTSGTPGDNGWYLSDVTVDFHDDLNRRGFSIQNPAAKSTCGCGSSFSM